MFPDSHGHPTQSFFSVIPAHVLIFRSEDGDWRLGSEWTKLGSAIICFLSPFDAMIEAAHFTRLGTPHHVMPVSQVDPSLFRDSDGLGLIADIHLAWPVKTGRILLRPRGGFGRYGRPMHHWAQEPPMFEV